MQARRVSHDNCRLSQATVSTDRVTKMKFCGCEYDYDTLQQSENSVDQSTAEEYRVTTADSIVCQLSERRK